MSMTWRGAPETEFAPISVRGWVRVIRRGVPVLCILGLGVLATLLLRLPERLLCGPKRPVTPFLTQWVCRSAIWLLGFRYTVRGCIMRSPGAVVANHVSWLDIFALNAAKRVYFVAKSEVAAWAGIGFLAQLTGTLFIKRDPRHAQQQTDDMVQRFQMGHKLLFFPEGTSTDGLRVLPFKPVLFEAFFKTGQTGLAIQPVALQFIAPRSAPAGFYGWWGDMGFGDHLLHVLSAPRQGEIVVHYLPPLRLADFSGRKAIAAAAQTAIQQVIDPD